MNDVTIAPKTLPAVLFYIPAGESDQEEFRRYGVEVRKDVERYLAAFRKIAKAKNVKQGCQEQAAALSAFRGFSYDRLRTRYYEYVRCGDWRCLINDAKAGRVSKEKTNLAPDFIEYWKGQCQDNQKASRPQYRKLKRDWAAGKSIPGYGTWQEWFMDKHPMAILPAECPPDLPDGWSPSNLYRLLPTKAELDLARRGIAAARARLPDILTSRVGLKPLEFVMFDDVKTDFRIIVPECGDTPVDLHLLVCIDVATGMILRYGLRPAIWRDDGARDGLKLRDMKRLLGGLLTQYGYPKDYIMTFIVENATAAIRDGTAAALAEISCEHIDVSRTIMIEGTSIFGGYKDRALGNPAGKGLLEVSFRLMHSELGAVPGQVGRRYDEGPAELHGRTAEAKELLKGPLTAFQRAAMRLPFLNIDQARLVLTQAFNQMIHRSDHAMEGFDLVGEWREKEFEQWQPEAKLLELPVSIRQNVIWRNPPRLESPFERWEKLIAQVGGMGQFQRIHPAVLPALYDQDQQLVPVVDDEIVIRLDKVSYHYRIAQVQHADLPLRNGETYLAYFNRQEMDWIHLTNGKGGYMGSIPRTRGIRRGDKDATAREMERRNAELKALRERVSARMPHVAEQRLEELAHNIEIYKDADSIDLAPTSDGTQAVPNSIAQVHAASADIKRQAAAVKRIDVVAEQLKKDLPVTPITEDWV